MNKKINIQSKPIYEDKNVYGTEEKLLMTSSNRHVIMLEIVSGLENKPLKVLDIGGGMGFFSSEIKNMYEKAEIVVADISRSALRVGRIKYKNLTFKHMDSEKNMSFNDGEFDLVISGEHIEHLKDVDLYLSEINRILGKKGYLLITTPNLASWFNRCLLLFGKQPFHLDPSLVVTLPIFSLFGKTFPENLNSSPPGHLRLYTHDMFKKLLIYYGFIPVLSKGRTMLSKPILRHIDSFFSRFPDLAFGQIILAKKKS